MNNLFFRCLASVLLLSSCAKTVGEENAADPWDSLDPITVSEISNSGGKTHLEVDGKPFAVYGAQIRLDIFRSVDKLEWKDIEPYFEKAVELGVNCVQLSYPWYFLEPKQDQYNYDELDHLLDLALKYNLKVELLWFSTNFIGDTYTWLVPTYLLTKPELRLKRLSEGSLHGLYGYTYSIDFADEWVLEREVKAIGKLFGHIRWWDSRNGNPHTVISCQVHNEPDALVRWRLAEKQISWQDGTLLSNREAWDMTLRALDVVGQAVQASKYRVATRTNIISGNGVNDFPQTPGISPKDVYALKGIDFVSFDPYMTSVNQIAFEVSQYGSLPGNYPLIAENRGDFANSPSLILAASALGGGYDIYDLATSRYITQHSAPPFNTEGIYESDLSPKPHTPRTSRMIRGLVAASEQVAMTPPEDFAAFNVVGDNPERNIVQTVCTTGASFTFQTSEGALGFALDRGDRILAYSTEPATLTVKGGRIEGNDSGVILLEASKLYEFGYSSETEFESTTLENIGTIFK